MSDLIAHLRDLLVYKVKPDALADEAAPELQSSLGAEAALIEIDRLLDLIEQFAAAEGRMKWAPNKKLHFEVAVIKAIQTLSQVSLTEVIENLTALRGGSAPDDHAGANSRGRSGSAKVDSSANSRPSDSTFGENRCCAGRSHHCSRRGPRQDLATGGPVGAPSADR